MEICICGNENATFWAAVDGFVIATCTLCGVRRVVDGVTDTEQAFAYINGRPFSQTKFLAPDIKDSGLQRRTLESLNVSGICRVANPLDMLTVCAGLLKRDGSLYLTFPDMSSREAENYGLKFNAINPRQNLWHFTKAQMIELVMRAGFCITSIQDTGAGWAVIEAQPECSVTEVTIYGPPGVGDTMWTLCKIPAVREREEPCKIKYVVCTALGHKGSERSKDLLAMCNWIDSYEFRESALPADIGNWDARIPVYNLIANYFLEPNEPGKLAGNRIEEWRPELKTTFDGMLDIPELAFKQAKELVKVWPYTVVYFSSAAWNDHCTAHQAWFPMDWARLCLRLKDKGITPVVLGCDWDADYVSQVAQALKSLKQEPDSIWLNLTSRTTLPLAMAIMHDAVATIGICAGLPMAAAQMGWPTVMLWPKKGALKRPITMNFCSEFQTNWVPPNVLDSGSYHPMSFGEFTEADIMRWVQPMRAVCRNV